MGAPGDRDPSSAHAAGSERVVESRPQVQVLFTSGYSEDAALYGGVADREAFFLAKPYSVHDLSSRVRDVLDAARS